jgi:hypothetical protein
VSFNSSSAAQNITICSFANATSNPSLPLVLSGINSSLYTINNQANAILSITTASVVSPVISITVYNSTSNTTTLNITSNQQGIVYYVIAIGNNASNLNFNQIKTAISTSNTTIQSQADFQTHLYVTDRFEYVNQIAVTAGIPSFVSQSPLLPSTSYTICGYFQSTSGTVISSSPTCTTFTTPNTP